MKKTNRKSLKQASTEAPNRCARRQATATAPTNVDHEEEVSITAIAQNSLFEAYKSFAIELCAEKLMVSV